MLKAAAIDVGSSATRLSQLILSDAGIVHQLEFKRFDMRLGADVFAAGRLSKARQSALVHLFADLAASLRQAGFAHCRAVATSAMRDARNAPAVCRAVQQASGLHLEVISGSQEGGLSRRALTRALGTIDDDALMVDLGGGSLEVERVGAHGASPGGAASLATGRISQSVPMGTVRLLALYGSLRGPMSPAALAEVRGEILARLRRVLGAASHPANVAFGTGGNLEALAKILGRTGGLVAQFDSDALGELAQRVAPMAMRERERAFHLRADRADLLLPAILVLDALAHVYQVKQFVVPHTGLRDALLLDLIEAQTLSSLDHVPLCTSVGLALFDLLYPLHGLWPPARRAICVVSQSFFAHGEKPHNTDDVQATLAAQKPEVAALCRSILAHLHSQPAPEQPAAVARAGAILALVMRLGQALVQADGSKKTACNKAQWRLDVVAEPARLFVGHRCAVEFSEPLSRALDCRLVLT